MARALESQLSEKIGSQCHRLSGSRQDYDPLLELIGESRFVLLGEASHGTHEFYRERALITRRLIEEKGFAAVAVEADWPDAYRVNRFVRDESDDKTAADSLSGFRRFPEWMWRNADVLDFVDWLRQYNDARPVERRVGFYGLDLYSLHASIQAVLQYLDKVDPDAAARARHRYSCFEHFGQDTQAYGYATGLGLTQSCEQAVVKQLIELRQRAAEYARRDGRVAADEYFFAEQNARLVKNAEHYYRTMFRGEASSWNLRDSHMTETLDALFRYLSAQSPARIVVWEHNSHLGDARATEVGGRGEFNVGQLVRDRYGSAAVLVGFTTYGGTVTAASNWDGPAERKRVLPALPESYEFLFHAAGAPRFLLRFRGIRGDWVEELQEPRLERAIGVIYRPDTERASHYFYAKLPSQFDAVLHFDQTRAVVPLEYGSHWKSGEVPETFPSGM
ncbi:MAG TPA: erythromycin esterase family protein [Acidobacteriota bacterium]|jgi:erythromycin esterase-like protein